MQINMRIFYISILALSLFNMPAKAQLEKKITASVFLGVPLFAKAEGTQGENIYKGYAPIPYLGIGMNYNLNTHIGIGANIKQLFTSKPNYSLANTNLGISLKYNIIPFDKKISPFVYAEANAGVLSISQKANSVTEYPKIEDGKHVEFESQVRNYPNIKTSFTCFGVLIGAGLDFTFKLRYGLFVSANYMLTNAADNFVSTEKFSDNTSKFNFIMVQAGARFSFGRKNSVY